MVALGSVAAPDIYVRHLRAGSVDGISLVVPPGQRVALLGPNGAGKSTLVRAVAGLVAPTAGQAAARGPVGYVPQDFRASLLPWLTVRRNITLPLSGGRGPRAREQERLDAVLRLVPALPALLSRYPYQLSGGEQQLVTLARSMSPPAWWCGGRWPPSSPNSERRCSS